MLSIVVIAVLFTAVQAALFNINNIERGPIWIGIQGNPGHPHLHNGGFILQQGQGQTVQAPDNWAGRFWARTWCDPNSHHCDTGDCGNKIECNGAGGVPPATLVEFTLKGWGGLDYYDVSLVDGYNIRVAVEPVNGQGDGGQYSCKKCQCSVNLLANCPEELKIRNKSGNIVACNSACGAFNTDQYCCRGAHSTPETCRSSDWPHNYPAFFKQNCPDAYSYAYDDHKSTFTCRAGTYTITFGGS